MRFISRQPEAQPRHDEIYVDSLQDLVYLAEFSHFLLECLYACVRLLAAPSAGADRVWRAQLRRVLPEQPILRATDWNAVHCEP